MALKKLCLRDRVAVDGMDLSNNIARAVVNTR